MAGGYYYDSWEYVRRTRHLSAESDYPSTGSSESCNKEKSKNSLTEGYGYLQFFQKSILIGCDQYLLKNRYHALQHKFKD